MYGVYECMNTRSLWRYQSEYDIGKSGTRSSNYESRYELKVDNVTGEPRISSYRPGTADKGNGKVALKSKEEGNASQLRVKSE